MTESGPARRGDSQGRNLLETARSVNRPTHRSPRSPPNNDAAS
jgi:hypothetical protein